MVSLGDPVSDIVELEASLRGAVRVKQARMGNKFTAMLRFTLNPWTSRVRQRVKPSSVITSQCGWPLSDNIRVRMRLGHAPEQYREVFRQAHDDVKVTFTEARLHIRGVLQSGRIFSHVERVHSVGSTGVVPTQVDAVRGVGGKATNRKGQQDRSSGSGDDW